MNIVLYLLDADIHTGGVLCERPFNGVITPRAFSLTCNFGTLWLISHEANGFYCYTTHSMGGGADLLILWIF